MASRRGIVFLLRCLHRRPYLIPSSCSTASTAHLFYATRLANKPMVESFEFQAETKNLLDIVAKSLYSDQEVNFILLVLESLYSFLIIVVQTMVPCASYVDFQGFHSGINIKCKRRPREETMQTSGK